MALEQDPYRILGLARGATLDDVKRAYRRLAKTHHPDAAGETALPRFLAIQAAYEQLTGGTTGSAASTRGRGAPPAPRRPWEADPDRSDATRRAYGGRARSAPPGSRATPRGGTPGRQPGGGAAGSPGTRGSGTGRPGTGSPGTGGSDSSGTRSGPAGETRGGTSATGSDRTGRRSSGSSEGPGAAADPGASPPPDPGTGKKATLGSTSYDGADAGPFEPDWRGASWYGTTSGTYWTLNPKEYADPRKHGPEYQARARRAARARSPETGIDPSSTAGPAAPADPAVGPADATSAPAAGPTHTTSSWWDSTAGAGADAPAGMPEGGATRGAPSAAWASHAATGSRSAGAARAGGPSPEPPDPGRAAADLARALADPRSGGPRARILRAVVGWLPIAYAVAWIVGEVTGCGRFAATCDGAADPLVLVLQVAVLGLLLAAPTLASLAAMAALTLVPAAIVATFVLSATGEMVDGDPRRVALGAIMLVAWLVGLAVAVTRRLRSLPPPPRPVS